MDLPEVRDELRNVADALVDTEASVIEALFQVKIIVEGIADGIRAGVYDRLAPQHPFLFGDVIVADLSGEFVDSVKQTAMDRDQLFGRENERVLREKLSEARRDLVRLFGTALRIEPCRFAFIVAVDQLVRLLQRDVAVNVLLCGLDQIRRGLQSVHILQTDRRLPYIAFLLLIRFALSDIIVKIKVDRFAHSLTTLRCLYGYYTIDRGK